MEISNLSYTIRSTKISLERASICVPLVFLGSKDSPLGKVDWLTLTYSDYGMKLKIFPKEVRSQINLNQSIIILKDLFYQCMKSRVDIQDTFCEGFPQGLQGEESTCYAGDTAAVASLMPGLGKSPGEGNGNQLQYPCLENPVDRGAWQATVHEVTKESNMT